MRTRRSSSPDRTVRQHRQPFGRKAGVFFWNQQRAGVSMNYLAASEYTGFGLEDATDASWIAAASAVIEGHCRRPSLGVLQYSERIRMAEARNTLRLTYL